MKQYLPVVALLAFLPADTQALVLSGTSRAYDIQATATATVDPFLIGAPNVNLSLSASPLNQAQGSSPPLPYSTTDTVVTASTGIIADGILTHDLGVGAGAGVDHFRANSDINGSPGPHYANAEGNIASASYTLALAGIANILTVGASGAGVGGLITTTASVLSPNGGSITTGGSSNLLSSGVTLTVLGFTPAALGLTLVSGTTSSVVLAGLNVPGVGTVSGTVSVGLNLFDVTGLSLTTATATSTALRVTLDLALTTGLAVTDIDSSVTINQSTASLVTNAVPEPGVSAIALAAGLLMVGGRRRSQSG